MKKFLWFTCEVFCPVAFVATTFVVLYLQKAFVCWPRSCNTHFPRYKHCLRCDSEETPGSLRQHPGCSVHGASGHQWFSLHRVRHRSIRVHLQNQQNYIRQHGTGSQGENHPPAIESIQTLFSQIQENSFEIWTCVHLLFSNVPVSSPGDDCAAGAGYLRSDHFSLLVQSCVQHDSRGATFQQHVEFRVQLDQRFRSGNVGIISPEQAVRTIIVVFLILFAFWLWSGVFQFVDSVFHFCLKSKSVWISLVI